MNSVQKYFGNVMIGFDQLFNTWWGGCPDETISSRLGRLKEANGGKIPWYRPLPKAIDCFLDRLQKNHSLISIERDELNKIKNESVFDGQYDQPDGGKT